MEGPEDEWRVGIALEVGRVGHVCMLRESWAADAASISEARVDDVGGGGAGHESGMSACVMCPHREQDRDGRGMAATVPRQGPPSKLAPRVPR